MEKCTHSLSWYAKRMWQLCPAEEAALRWHRCISIWRCCCCNLLSSFYYDSNWPTSGGQAGKVSFVFQLSRVFNFTFGSLKKCTYRIYTYLFHSSTQATHLHATAYDHDAGEDNRGVHATHLEAHQHTLPAAHASRPDVHARSTGARTGLPGCHQAQVDTAHDLRLLHGLDPWDAPLGCVHETWVERNGAHIYPEFNLLLLLLLPLSHLHHALPQRRQLHCATDLQLSGWLYGSPLRAGCEWVRDGEALRSAVCQYAGLVLLSLPTRFRIAGRSAELSQDLIACGWCVRGTRLGERYRWYGRAGGDASAEDRTFAGQWESAHEWVAEIVAGHLRCGGHTEE